MRVDPLGDCAFVLRDLAAPAYRVANALRALRIEGIQDVAASYETVGVYTSIGALQSERLHAIVQALAVQGEPVERLHVVPVCYEVGPDLDEVARALGIDPEEVVRLHMSEEYRCFAIGFRPGFPYLGWLPQALRGVPRRGSPRVRVEPGSVGITGSQTGIYPSESPGGWALIGRTPLTIADLKERFFPIVAGDKVRFEAIGRDEFHARLGERLDA